MKKKLAAFGIAGLLLLGVGGCQCWFNKPPVASFTANPLSGVAPLTVSFNALSSYDPDGTIVEYRWDFGDGTVGYGQQVTHTYYNPGIYYPVLTVTDDCKAVSKASPVTIQVIANKPPVACFTLQWWWQEDVVIAQLDPRCSYDPDGQIVEYRWQIDGYQRVYTYPYVLRVIFYYEGTYTISLTVKDNLGATATSTKTFYVYFPYSSPKSEQKEKLKIEIAE